MNDELNLTVAVPAVEWAYLHRRLAFLEVVVIRVAREDAQAREWFSAAQLKALRLPGLPASRNGITAKATREDWERRNAKGPMLRLSRLRLPRADL